jgi:pimeloyl-ACP methyl ester carboxylesterase
MGTGPPACRRPRRRNWCRAVRGVRGSRPVPQRRLRQRRRVLLLEVTGALKEIIEAPDLSGFQAIDGRDVVAGALEGIERHALPEAVREDYLAAYAGDRFIESAAYVRSYPSDLPVLAERLGDIRTPIQIIAGRHDALVPPSNAEFLHERLADSKLDILETGHFMWEDGADDYLQLGDPGSKPTARLGGAYELPKRHRRRMQHVERLPDIRDRPARWRLRTTCCP